jgi:hypothetical protein
MSEVTAWKYPGNVSSDWTNKDNIKADDGSVATDAVAKNGYSAGLTGSNFLTGVPPGATIDGIEFEIKKAANAANDVVDNSVYLLVNGNAISSNMASGSYWPTSLGVVTYGGPTNMCGTTLSQANAVDPTFELSIDCHSGSGTTVSVDCYRIRIYYTPGASNKPLPDIQIF